MRFTKRGLPAFTRSLFRDDPQRGAEYFGAISKMSVEFCLNRAFSSTPEEAGIRARIAAHYARRLLRPGTRKRT